MTYISATLGHLSLNLEPKSTEYRVLVNEAGQILLDPITNIPDREQWLWQNPQALASVLCIISGSKARSPIPTIFKTHCAKTSLTFSRNKRTAALCPIALLCSIKPGISAIGKNGKAKLFSLSS